MNLDKIFYPQGIAIVGASTKVGSVGNDVVKNLAQQGYAGKVYPVNPKAEEIYGLKCYADLNTINEAIDLMVIIVPAVAVPGVLLEGAKLGIKAAIIISAGFKEAGNFDLENEVRQVCLDNNIALIGPNCLGVINSEISMNASFATLMPAVGEVAFISQSGALCTAVLDYAQKLNLGFSKFMSIGNKAVIDELAILEYLATDEKTKVIAMYAEQLTKSKELIQTIKKITQGANAKPVIILKSGRTSAGANASASHTGALAGNDSAYEALFRQSGAIRALSVAELFDYIQVFTNNKIAKTENVAIITNAGGPGVLATDEIISDDLALAKLDEATVNNLKAYMPAAANSQNPVDVLGDAKADRYQKALELVAQDKNVDSIIVILTPQSITEIQETAKAIVETKKITTKPIVTSFMGEATIAPGAKILTDGEVANFYFPEQAIKALSIMDKFYKNAQATNEELFNFSDIDKNKVAEIFATAKSNNQTSFPEAQALEILEAYKFPILKSRIATTATEAATIAQDINTLLVMKIVSPDILHKSDVGGVMLNIKPEEAAVKFDEMMAIVSKNKPEAKLVGVLLVEMAPKGGAELILGSTQDPNLGNTVMVGMGGIYVEILKDVVFGLAPITKTDAFKMINCIKAKKIFEGARGQGELDVESLVDALGRLSQLLVDFPEIVELDVNPLLVLPKGQGSRVLDARIVIA